jgi:hypothetical protein
VGIELRARESRRHYLQQQTITIHVVNVRQTCLLVKFTGERPDVAGYQKSPPRVLFLRDY